MATRTLGVVVAGVWLASDLLYFGWLCAQVLGERRAAMAAMALRPWVSKRVPAAEFGGSLDLDEAQVWWRRLERANVIADRAGCSTGERAERTVTLEGLGMGA